MSKSGLLFRRKDSDGDIIDRKRVSSNELSHHEIRDMAKHISGDANTRNAVREIIESADRSGNVSRERIHKGLQEAIVRGEFTEDKAESIARQLGMFDKRFHKFKDRSEWKRRHPSDKSVDEEENKTDENKKQQRSDFASQKESSKDKSATDTQNNPPQKKSIYNFVRRF